MAIQTAEQEKYLVNTAKVERSNTNDSVFRKKGAPQKQSKGDE